MQLAEQSCILPTWSAAWPKSTIDSFAGLMGQQGSVVSTSLMRFDRAYAFEQLASAHAAADWRLQRLAVELFEQACA